MRFLDLEIEDPVRMPRRLAGCFVRLEEGGLIARRSRRFGSLWRRRAYGRWRPLLAAKMVCAVPKQRNPPEEHRGAPRPAAGQAGSRGGPRLHRRTGRGAWAQTA